MSEVAHSEETTSPKETIVNPENNNEEAQETVLRSDHVRVLDDMKKFKLEVQSLKEQLANRDMDELKKKEEWQKVAQIKEAEALSAKEESENLRKAMVWDKKFSSLKTEALKAGIRKEALSDLELIDFEDDVAIETTSSGKINVLGVEQAVSKLKASRPHWFSARSANINSDNPETIMGGKVTMKDVFDAEKKAKESGDYAPYLKVLKEYKKQNQ